MGGKLLYKLCILFIFLFTFVFLIFVSSFSFLFFCICMRVWPCILSGRLFRKSSSSSENIAKEDKPVTS